MNPVEPELWYSRRSVLVSSINLDWSSFSLSLLWILLSNVLQRIRVSRRSHVHVGRWWTSCSVQSSESSPDDLQTRPVGQEGPELQTSSSFPGTNILMKLIDLLLRLFSSSVISCEHDRNSWDLLLIWSVASVTTEKSTWKDAAMNQHRVEEKPKRTSKAPELAYPEAAQLEGEHHPSEEPSLRRSLGTAVNRSIKTGSLPGRRSHLQLIRTEKNAGLKSALTDPSISR